MIQKQTEVRTLRKKDPRDLSFLIYLQGKKKKKQIEARAQVDRQKQKQESGPAWTPEWLGNYPL